MEPNRRDTSKGELLVRVSTIPLQLRVPSGLHSEMVRLISSEARWSGRQEFVLEAIKEKIDRHGKENPSGAKR
jgi:hypothetical protein